MQRDTLILHAGYRAPREPGAHLAGPQFSSTFGTPGDPSAHALTYGRFHNPTWSAWEGALGALEGGTAIAYASGMASISALFGVCLRPGDVLVLPEGAYYTTRLLAGEWLASLGVKIRYIGSDGSGAAESLVGARLLFLETPSNPELEISDIRALATLAAEAGVLVAVDNTTATPYLQQPLLLGADFVVASDTKGLAGHADLILGHVATRDAEHAAALHTWRTRHGAIPGPMEVWLAHRSLATLPVRSRRQCESAQRLAEYLSARSEVAAVRYPGLPSHPGHEVARRQMSAFGCVIGLDLGEREAAERFLSSLALVREETSFGSVHSSAERRARWGSDSVGEGYIRFSVGCEAPEDLLEDVDRALRAVHR